MLTPIDLPRCGLRARLKPASDGADRVTAVFLHGLGCAPTSWPMRAPLPPGVSAAFLDLPGHGAARDPLPDRFERIAEPVCTAIEELALEKVMLVAHSFGGMVALYAEPGLAARLVKTVLFCTGTRFASVRGALAAVRRAERLEGSKHVVIPAAPDTVKRQAAATLYRAGRDTMIRGLSLLDSHDAESALPELRPLPRWLVYGTRDAMVPVPAALTLARKVDARAVELTGVGHFPMLERPQRFHALLYEMLDLDDRRDIGGVDDRPDTGRAAG